MLLPSNMPLLAQRADDVCAAPLPLAAVLALLQNSPSSKGCGLVVMGNYSDAASAIVGLDNYRWEGMHSAMVVKLMAPQRQRQEQLSTATSG